MLQLNSVTLCIMKIRKKCMTNLVPRLLGKRCSTAKIMYRNTKIMYNYKK